MVSVLTIGRKIDFLRKCIAESTGYFFINILIFIYTPWNEKKIILIKNLSSKTDFEISQIPEDSLDINSENFYYFKIRLKARENVQIFREFKICFFLFRLNECPFLIRQINSIHASLYWIKTIWSFQRPPASVRNISPRYRKSKNPKRSKLLFMHFSDILFLNSK